VKQKHHGRPCRPRFTVEDLQSFDRDDAVVNGRQGVSPVFGGFG